jgi:hypothetical protein
MWFAKLFGGDREDDSEPSEHPPHPAAVRTSKSASSEQPPQHNVTTKKAAPRKGFDPYNSGGFDKNKAWSRVIR